MLVEHLAAALNLVAGNQSGVTSPGLDSVSDQSIQDGLLCLVKSRKFRPEYGVDFLKQEGVAPIPYLVGSPHDIISGQELIRAAKEMPAY